MYRTFSEFSKYRKISVIYSYCNTPRAENHDSTYQLSPVLLVLKIEMYISMTKRLNILCPLFQKLILYVQSKNLDALRNFAKYQVSKIIRNALFLHNNIWHFNS
jgi:hypothetical protein